jgi:hypothetical protein
MNETMDQGAAGRFNFLAVPSQTQQHFSDRVGELALDLVDESLFQLACAPISIAQLYSNEDQHTFDKYRLRDQPDVPDCLVAKSLSAPIVGLRGAAGFDSPKIDPGWNGRIALRVRQRTK